MMDSIVTAAGIPHRSGSSPADLPVHTCVYIFDTIKLDGPDRVPQSSSFPCVAFHSVHLEMYEPKEDDASEAALEKQLLLNGLLFTKSDREWLANVQRYAVNYDLTYTTKL